MHGDRTAKSQLNAVKIAESQFVDDLVLYITGQDKLENVSAKFVEETIGGD